MLTWQVRSSMKQFYRRYVEIFENVKVVLEAQPKSNLQNQYYCLSMVEFALNPSYSMWPMVSYMSQEDKRQANAPVENWFKLDKHNYFTEKRNKVDRFVRENECNINNILKLTQISVLLDKVSK